MGLLRQGGSSAGGGLAKSPRILWHTGAVIASVLSSLAAQPALALFLILGFGYLIGNIKLFGFQLGHTTGVLLVGRLRYSSRDASFADASATHAALRSTAHLEEAS